MPYRFKINEPVEKGFRRIAREQLDVVARRAGGVRRSRAIGVHECRKALKRLRALVRLGIGCDRKWRRQRRRTKALGEIAQLLSARRDQTVMLQTIGKLAVEVPDAADRFGAVACAPRRSCRRSVGEASRRRYAPRRLACFSYKRRRNSRARSSQVAASRRSKADWRRAIGQARKATKYAYDEPSDESFHTLRKAVQWHWRQMSLLARAWPDEFAVRGSAWELSQLLGDDHDLAMLIGAASTAADISVEQKEATVALCQRQQQVLRATAEFRAKRLFAETPQAFIKRVSAYWRYSRSLDPRVDVPAPARRDTQPDDAAPAADGQIAAPDKRPAPSKPRLAAKSVPSTPSQRRA